MQQKRVLIVSLEYPPQIGGIATYVDALAGALDGEQTAVMAPPMKDATEWDESRPYGVIRKPFLYPKLLWPRWIRLCFHLRRFVKKQGVELIMVQHVLPVGYAAIIVKKLLGVPFLLFSHGTDLLAGTATPWKKRMVTMVSKHAQQITFNSESLKGRFLKEFPQFEDKARVLYPCPDQDLFNPPAKEEIQKIRTDYALEGKRVILSISRLDEGKGFPHLIRLMPEILKRVPNLVWIIIGEGPKRKQILDLIRKNSLQNVVRFIGLMPHEQIKKYYYLADLFVLLTHPDEGREEGLGLVFLEAAAAGMPVLAGRSGGVEEGVIHTRTGLVYDVMAQTDEIVESIYKLLTDEKFANTLGTQAQARIKSQFQWDHQITQIHPWIYEGTPASKK